MNETDTAVTIINYKRRRKTNLYGVATFIANTHTLVIFIIRVTMCSKSIPDLR